MVGISKLTFGAYDVAPGNYVASPAPVSETPINDKHGYIQSDLYGTKKTVGHKQEQANDSYEAYSSPQYSQYPQQHKKRSILKPILILGALTVGGVVAYKKRKNISEFFKGIFKKGSNTNTPASNNGPTQSTNKKLPMRDRPPHIISNDKFAEYYDDAMNKLDIDDVQAINPQDMKVIFKKDATPAEKKETLEKLYELATIYTQREYQPRITLIMPGALKDKGNDIVDMFMTNKIGDVKDKYINRIEGFKILSVERQLSDRHDMIVEKQVRHGVNANEPQDVINKWGRNVGELFKRIL